MIRKFIHFDYYQRINPEWAKAPLLIQHSGNVYLSCSYRLLFLVQLLKYLSLDHCVDMLRDVLMCHSDTGLIVYHWIKGYVSPMPDFSTLVSSDHSSWVNISYEWFLNSIAYLSQSWGCSAMDEAKWGQTHARDFEARRRDWAARSILAGCWSDRSHIRSLLNKPWLKEKKPF